jgi:broad specificity phosphatase PhoE
MTSTTKAGSPVEPAFADSTEIWVVRHGETEWSVSGQHTGTTDIPLTENGERQATALRGLLTRVRPIYVLSSPLSRALETARLAGVEVDEIIDDLGEWDYGDYEGLTSHEIHETRPGWTVFADGCPNGESVADVQQRADRVLARVAEHLADGPVMLFGHGHFSRALGARWIGLPAAGGASLLLGTAAPSVLGAGHGKPALLRWNMPNPAA